MIVIFTSSTVWIRIRIHVDTFFAALGVVTVTFIYEFTFSNWDGPKRWRGDATDRRWRVFSPGHSSHCQTQQFQYHKTCPLTRIVLSLGVSGRRRGGENGEVPFTKEANYHAPLYMPSKKFYIRYSTYTPYEGCRLRSEQEQWTRACDEEKESVISSSNNNNKSYSTDLNLVCGPVKDTPHSKVFKKCWRGAPDVNH